MIQVFRPIPAEKLKLLVFDLDGTLIDSAQDLSNSVNAALTHIGQPELPEEIIAGFVGNGALMMVQRALAHRVGGQLDAVDKQDLETAYRFFLDYYREHHLDFTYAYNGVMESLAALRLLHEDCGGHPRQMAIVTNKPVRPAQSICAGLGMADYFVRIYGGDSFASKKPDPEGLLAVMREVGATPEETVMVGDSAVDVQLARNAGVWSLGCAFGFGPQNLMENSPDVVVDSAADWTTVLRPATI